MQLLHLVGATTTRFYYELSATYHAATVTPAGMRAHVLKVAPDGTLLLRLAGESGDRQADLGEVARVAATCDLVVPFMFCPSGMTGWRELFEGILGVPVVGPPLATTVVSTSKLQTKALARSLGIAVPDGVRVASLEDAPRWRGPCIVKPDKEDNSIGLSLVRDEAELVPALELALEHGEAIVEDYIPGREIRAGVLDADGEVRMLPLLEYHMTADHPIRVRADKVDVDETGHVTRRSWDVPSLETSCAPDTAADVAGAIAAMVLKMHAALGARDYSLYDIRVDERTNEPFLLEACSFWTFAPMSIVSRMVVAEGADLEDVTRAVFEQAARRISKAPRAA